MMSRNSPIDSFFSSIIHLILTLIFNFFIMRQLEIYAGVIRIILVFMLSGTAGSMASAIFLPYRVEVKQELLL